MRALLVVFFLTLCEFASPQQPGAAAKNSASPVPGQNVGRILFSASALDPNNAQPTDFLDSYLLTPSSDLFFTAFMAEPLTAALRRIDPNADADSLAKNGNFQFSLQIDGRSVYVSNLMPGAPSRAIRDSASAIHKPLINNSAKQGIWTESFWGRFLRAGGDKALTEGRHLLRMEIRPYVTVAGVTKVGAILAAGDLPMEVKRIPKIDLDTIAISAIRPYDGLPVSDEGYDRDKIKALKGNILAGVFKKISSVVVIKNGRILIEEYFNGETRDSLHDPRSVGKSFASTVAGIAVGDGHLKNERQPLKDFYDLRAYGNYSSLKANIRLYDLLTMSSAFDGNDEDGTSAGNEENMYPTPDWVRFALDLPVKAKPDGQWHYFTAGVVLLGDILNKVSPGGLEKYADGKLFKPLGITDYKWEYTPQGVPNTAGSIRMKALDFAKYGQLYKNQGQWNGRQLIPKDWIAKTFTRQKSLPGRPGEYYGYLFWNRTFHVNGKDHEAWYCAGNGGNSIFIFKDLPLVVVVTATAYGQLYAHEQVDRMVEEFVLGAVCGGD